MLSQRSFHSSNAFSLSCNRLSHAFAFSGSIAGLYSVSPAALVFAGRCQFFYDLRHQSLTGSSLLA